MTNAALIDPFLKTLTLLMKNADDIGILVEIQGCSGGGKSMRFRSVSGRQQEHPVTRVIQSSELHDFPFSRERGDGKAIAHALAEGGEVWNNIVDCLCPVQMPTKSGDHFVENKKSTIFVTDTP